MKRVLLIQFFNYEVEPTEDIAIEHMMTIIGNAGYMVKSIRCNSLDTFEFQIFEDYNPQYVGITLFGINVVLGQESINSHELYELCKKIKQYNNNILICLGGKFAADHDVEIFHESNDIDFILKGTAEKSTLDLLKNEKDSFKEVNGLTYRNGNDVIQNRFVDDFESKQNPIANRSLLAENHIMIASITTSQSCSGECAFCNYPASAGKWKGYPIENAVSEIEDINSKYGIRFFQFVDRSLDNPNINIDRVRDLADCILKSGVNISFQACFRANFYSHCDQKTLLLLKEAGLVGSIIGIESGNAHDLLLYNKKITLNDIEIALDICLKNRIVPEIGFINFNPLSTVEKLKDNVNLLMKYHLSWNMVKVASSLYPIKGTELYKKFSEEYDLLSINKNDFTKTKFMFLDGNIENLHRFVQEFYINNKKSFSYAKYCFERLPMILFDLERFLKYSHYENMLDDLEDVISVLEDERNKLSEIVGKWFLELLQYVYFDDAWAKYDEITTKYSVSKKIKYGYVNMLDSFIKLKNKLNVIGINYLNIEVPLYGNEQRQKI